MTEPIQPASPANHAAHDATWIAALASRDPDLSPSERTRAEALLESCGACADLFADLVAVSAAIPSAAIPSRPRDFTLTEADAARLRPGGLRRWVAAIGSVRDGITFPLAMGLTTMGIAGLLFATVPGALSSMSGATAGAAPETLSTVGAPALGAGGAAPAASAAAAASAAPAASRDAAALVPASAAPMPAESLDKYLYSNEPDSEITGEGGVFSGDGEDSAQRQDAAEMAQDASIRDDATGVSTLAVVAATLLLAGLGLFALRWTSRRLGG
jgi:anti-sigma factor RsiW